MENPVYVLSKSWNRDSDRWPVAVYNSLYKLCEDMKDKKIITSRNDSVPETWQDKYFEYSWESVEYFV